MSNYKQFFSDPFVGTYDNFLTEEECNHFIKLSKNNLERALVSNNKAGYKSNGRTGSNFWISHNYDQITKSVAERISNIVGLPLENAENFQIIHYSITQEYSNHYDSWLHDGSKKTLRCMKRGGARIKTALCYLNDVKKGGGTRMIKLDKTIEAKKGKLLIFDNTYKDTNIRHPLSLHAGMPIIEGEKFAFNLWFRECKSNILYSKYNPDYYKTKHEIINIVNMDDEPMDEPTCKGLFDKLTDEPTCK
jgi:prolyl 4-hydroxylase